MTAKDRELLEKVDNAIKALKKSVMSAIAEYMDEDFKNIG